MNSFCCPHCLSITNTYFEGRLYRCLCGYWNDPQHPLRTIKDQDAIDRINMAEHEVPPNTHRPDIFAGYKDSEARREQLRKYNRNYRATHRDEIRLRDKIRKGLLKEVPR